MYLKLRCDATGLNRSVDFFKSDSVTKLREKAAELTDIDVDKIRLIVAGKVLVNKRDDGTDAQIYLDFNLKGGEVVMIFKQEKPALPTETAPSINRENVKEPKPPKKKAQVSDKKEMASSNMLMENAKKKKVLEMMPEEKPVAEAPATDGEGWFVCEQCTKNPERKCKICNCQVCGINKDSDKTLICDGYDATGACQAPIHFYCLTGKYKLKEMPEGDWYCPECQEEAEERVKQTVLPGKGIKLSAKKANSAAAKATRAWGRGVSCSGVGNKNTDVPTDYKGPIPGIQVGQTWQYRLQLSSSGVHRPPVGGIHASEAKGAFSIVMSGGYGDDEDKGDEIIYTGSGGRDLGGNKRVSHQSFDQVLKKANYGLAASCYPFKVNAEGGDAEDDWRKSNPIRVVRGTNKPTKKIDPFMPKKGFRYDGIYKVVKYYKVKGQEGFYVWKYLMRRDDETPAPWTKEGKARIERLGLKMIMGPQHEGEGGQKSLNDSDAPSSSGTKPGRKKRKNQSIDSDDIDKTKTAVK
uniref:RING-type E3 ubiquitin transferase n=1 Tax=Plectus sambesii TaxID=2011161 RepID=A0A914W973_9BILA